MYKYSEHSSVKNKPFSFILLILLIIGGIIGAFYFKANKNLLLVDLVVIISSLMVLLIWFFKNKANKLIVSESDILFEVGLLSKNRAEVALTSIRTIKIEQSFLNRIFSIGTIKIYTSGDNAEIVAKNMPDPHKFRALIKSRKYQDDNRP